MLILKKSADEKKTQGDKELEKWLQKISYCFNLRYVI